MRDGNAVRNGKEGIGLKQKKSQKKTALTSEEKVLSF